MSKENNKDEIAKHIADVMMQINVGKDKDFENWMKENQYASEVLKKLSDSKTFIENNKQFLVDDQEKERNNQILLRKIDKYNRRKLFIKISSIASVLIIILFVIWNNNSLYQNINTKKDIVISKTNHRKVEIPKIIAENGDVFYLKNQEKVVVSNNNIIQQNGIVISVPSMSNNIKDSVSYSNLVVPKQSTYTIELSDGTIVYMNANSKLRFPNKFIGSTREVSIEGEAFFKVTKNKKQPFIVNSRNTKIEVLGTQFNVNTYSENIVRTFLVEGSVGVKYNGNRTIILPNQLSVVNEMTNSNTILDIAINNQENIVGWLNDIFIFNNVEIREIIKTLSMWYGEELIIDTNLNERITARYKRTTPLEEIIKSLEIITGGKILK